jgi:hypothetical protein
LEELRAVVIFDDPKKQKLYHFEIILRDEEGGLDHRGKLPSSCGV